MAVLEWPVETAVFALPVSGRGVGEIRRLHFPREQHAGLLSDRNRDERFLDHALLTIDWHAGAVPSGQVLPAARALVAVLVTRRATCC